MRQPALLARILAAAIVAAQQHRRRPDQQLLERHPVAAQRPLAQAGQRHPLRRQPGRRDAAPAAAEPDRVGRPAGGLRFEPLDPRQHGAAGARPAERRRDAGDRPLDVGQRLRDRAGRAMRMPSRCAIRARSRAPPPMVRTRSGPQPGHRHQAAVVAPDSAGPARHSGVSAGCWARWVTETICSRLGEHQQQLVGAQVERGDPPRRRLRRAGQREANRRGEDECPHRPSFPGCRSRTRPDSRHRRRFRPAT